MVLVRTVIMYPSPNLSKKQKCTEGWNPTIIHIQTKRSIASLMMHKWSVLKPVFEMLDAPQTLEPAVNHDAQPSAQSFTLLHTEKKHIGRLDITVRV